MTHYRPARQRGPFFFELVVVGLVLLSIAILVWPTKARQAQRLLTSVAESLSCRGPVSSPQATSLRDILRAHVAEVATLQIAGPEAIDGSFSRDQLLESFAELCSVTTDFRVELSHVSVAVSEGDDRAQARADASIDYQLGGRTVNERRQALFTLRWTPSGWQVTSAQVMPRLVNQPEPRP